MGSSQHLAVINFPPMLPTQISPILLVKEVADAPFRKSDFNLQNEEKDKAI
jgi:hypothetical protein